MSFYKKIFAVLFLSGFAFCGVECENDNQVFTSTWNVSYHWIHQKTRMCNVRFDEVSGFGTRTTGRRKAKCVLPPGANKAEFGFFPSYFPYQSTHVAFKLKCSKSGNKTVRISDELYEVPGNSKITVVNETHHYMKSLRSLSVAQNILEANISKPYMQEELQLFVSNGIPNAADTMVSPCVSIKWQDAFVQIVGIAMWFPVSVRYISECLTDLYDILRVHCIEALVSKHVLYRMDIQHGRLSKALRFLYRALPDNMEDDIAAYLNFTARYGIYVPTFVLVGGYMVILTQKDIQRTYNIANELSRLSNALLIDMDRKNLQKALFWGGDFSSNLQSWIESIKESPSILEFGSEPLYTMIDKNVRSKKRQSLSAITDHISNSAKLRQIATAISSMQLEANTVSFLKNELYKEADQVCPDKEFVNLFTNYLRFGSSPNFERFYVVCKMSMHEKETTVSKKIFLFPGVCISNSHSFSCELTPELQPTELKCVRLYEEAQCLGDFVRVHENQYDTITGKSITICT